MSNKLQPVRGTHDILPDEFERFNAIINTARDIATLYGFQEMATPIFEQTDVFARSMGESSDVVSKEMFSFETRGGENVTLRPEFTAGIVRSFISNGMQQHLPLKLFSTGQVFRYERPQKGRQRQFHQVNFEWMGDDSWQADAEIIELAGRFLQSISAIKNNCVLHVNSLGDAHSRGIYRDKLVSYLNGYISGLSEDSKKRLVQNPLRILDSKDVGDRKILETAPVITDYLNKESKERFERICNYLQTILVVAEVKIDPKLVRGLDYYNGIVFEFVSSGGELGSQNTVLAGGRYDGLIEQMGGRYTPAIGFAAGVERLLLLAGESIRPKTGKITILPFEEVASEEVLDFAGRLRSALYEIAQKSRQKFDTAMEIDWNGKLSKRLEKAAKNATSHVVILSPEEAKEKKCIVKNMKTRIEQKILLSDFDDMEKLKAIFDIV